MITVGKPKELGADLKSARLAGGMSRHAVARPARISAAYLQKLEAGAVRNPSPRILERVAGVLNISYGRLMELAGYSLPPPEDGGGTVRVRPAGSALRTEDLTVEELRAVAAFIAHLKSLR
ncbi:MAG: helix-turn-helix domain-containing protein [SAR324 cluster bacterium]|nr:helix-turn-helix domain-containing protein [SAR324 cluster bacterium]